MSKKINIFYIFLFLSLLNISTFGWLVGITAKDDTERRVLAKMPEFSISKISTFPKEFESFINDNFGFRKIFIDAYTMIKLNLFRTPPFTTEILGKNNWLFFNPVDKDYKDWYSHVEFSLEELKHIKNKLEAEKEWLSARNIPYLIVIVPDKEDVYPEYYPYENKIGDIRLNQLLEYMKKNSDVEILYLKQDLLDAKKEYNFPLYYLYDTHWNNLGSFIGYQAIMKFLSSHNSSLQYLQKDDFEIEAKEYKKTNILDLIRGSAVWIEQPEVRMTFKIKEDAVNRIRRLNSVYVYGDSFSHIRKWDDAEEEGLAEYLNLNFVKYANYFDGPAYPLEYSNIEQNKPEIVIREVIQRNVFVLNAINCDETIKCN